jgi:hypothetical protein
MTDDSIEAKALALVNEVRAELKLQPFGPELCGEIFTALCRAIERHEAFKQEVSDAVGDTLFMVETHCDGEALALVSNRLLKFIIPKPKPDPLAQTLGDFDGTLWEPEDVLRFRAALEARGFEIRKKNDD